MDPGKRGSCLIYFEGGGFNEWTPDTPLPYFSPKIIHEINTWNKFLKKGNWFNWTFLCIKWQEVSLDVWVHAIIVFSTQGFLGPLLRNGGSCMFPFGKSCQIDKINSICERVAGFSPKVYFITQKKWQCTWKSKLWGQIILDEQLVHPLPCEGNFA